MKILINYIKELFNKKQDNDSIIIIGQSNPELTCLEKGIIKTFETEKEKWLINDSIFTCFNYSGLLKELTHANLNITISFQYQIDKTLYIIPHGEIKIEQTYIPYSSYKNGQFIIEQAIKNGLYPDIQRKIDLRIEEQKRYKLTTDHLSDLGCPPIE